MVERARDFAAGGIAVGVQNAVAAVRPFAGEGQLAAFAVELRAPVDQLPDGRGTLFHQGVDGGAVAQAVPRVERIPLVQFHLVVVAQRDGDPALRVLRGGFVQALLGHHQHRPGRGQVDGGAQPRHAGADYQEVRMYLQSTIIAAEGAHPRGSGAARSGRSLRSWERIPRTRARRQFVACALMRAASRLIGMLGGYPQVQRLCAGRPDESRRGTHECVRHVGAPILSQLLTLAVPCEDQLST